MFVARAIDRTAGGVERMIVTLMNDLAARGHEVELFTWDTGNAESFYPMASGIVWHRLNLGNPQVRAGKRLLLRRARAVRTLVGERKPQAIVCFQDGPFRAIRAYTIGLRIPVVAAERNAPSRFDHIAAARYQELIYQWLRLATRIVIQCESYRALYPKYLQRKIVCIPNPVSPAIAQAQPAAAGPSGRYRLLSVGRLGFQKNYDVLIEAFARLAPKFPDWDLAIVGDGERRTELEGLVRARSLDSRVALPGATKFITEWYASSQLFCLPSRWEGFPNALAEALAYGLPVVGFAGCAGVRDLVTHGASGFLAAGNGDVDTLTLALERAMSNADCRRSMSRHAIDSVKEFEPSKIFSQWEKLLFEVIR
jgi:GalNAc-alpha-(1->4)-GalNAc-alpha-(1->3)-diNAcBac-PP-undecaprenol alpha-1,4-N-acetyl-D-galactosaminyltransferase